MKNQNFRMCFILLLGFAFAFSIPSAYAQESDTEFQLEEVVVTAQKRAESQQKVPIQMEVVSGEDLIGTGKDNVDDILRDVSSVLINKNEDGMRITLRGLAEDAPTWFGVHSSTPTVAVNIDGAYNSSSSAGQNLFDIERVEVLAGPQSTLYGSNSPGGIVNVITAAPKTDRFEGSVTAEFGNYGLFDGQAVINVPIIKDLFAMRLSIQANERDTWVEGADNSQDTKKARIKALIEPTENFSATVTFNYTEALSGGRLGGAVLPFDYEDGRYEDGTPVTNPWTGYVTPTTIGGRGTTFANIANSLQREAETTGLQADIKWDTPIGSISFVPYQNEKESFDFRNDVEVWIPGETDPEYTTQTSDNKTEQKGADLRIVSPEDFPFKWIIGGTWYESERSIIRDDTDYDRNDRKHTNTQENRAIYANITYPFTEKIRGTAGLRYSWDEVSHTEEPARLGDGITGQEYSEPDYKLGFEYDLGERSMLYGSYATSYRVNSLATAQGLDHTVPPEELKSYTVGSKNRFFDNRLQVNASVFHYDYRNKEFKGTNEGRLGRRGAVYIESDPAFAHDGEPGTDLNNDGDYCDTNLRRNLPGADAICPGGYTSDLIGVALYDPWYQQFGDFESFGADISTDWIISMNDRLRLSVSYLDAEWTDCTVDFYWSWLWSTQGTSYAGKKATYSSEWAAHASYEHIFYLGSLGTLTPQIDFQYKSDYDLSFEYDYYPFNYQESYTLWNASMTFTHSSEKWSISAYVKNIGEYAAKTFWQNPSNSPRLGISDPRTYGVVFSYKF